MNQKIVQSLALASHYAGIEVHTIGLAYRRAIQQGCYGDADMHHKKWQEIKAAYELIEAALIKAQQGHDSKEV